jgi:amidase
MVAAGALPMAHANDGGGSTRIPAGINGLVGLKCSRGRVSLGPTYSDLTQFLISELAVTRTVRDTAALLDAVHGGAPGEAFQVKPPARPYMEEVADPPKNLKIAFAPGTWLGQAIDPEVSEAVRRTAALCESLGHSVEEAVPEIDAEEFSQAFGSVWSIDLVANLEAISRLTGRPINGDFLEKITLVMYAFGKAKSSTAYAEALAVVDQVAHSVGAFFEQYDLLLTPTLARQTPVTGLCGLDRDGFDFDSWLAEAIAYIPFTPVANVTGTPAISLPLAMDSDGLPMGMHFMAGMGDEARLIGLASALEEADPWIDRRPAVRVDG